MVVDFVTNKVWTNLNGIGIASLWDLLTGPFPNSLKEITSIRFNWEGNLKLSVS